MTGPDLWLLAGRRVVLTGAAGAVGREAAAAFSAAGAAVVGIDRNEEPLREMRKAGILADHLCGDLCDQAVQDAAADCCDADVLVNNVGAGDARPLADTDDELIDRMLDINLKTAAGLCRRFAPRMAARGRGKIINVSSVLALHPVPTVPAYAAAKAALIGFTRSAALEYAASGVQINVLAPGYLEGPKNAAYFASAAGRRFQERFMPDGKVGPADALNGPLLFLASAMSDHVTGHVLVVDGGYSIW
ncbi:SDR family oxidoreductase [Streptomyces sp. So13.3]|uniref:SDR family NAD(P)-dependent oxidoreductase n=1 Tax=Streptomyces TaxID=1883 RepID=UPI001106DCE7|nr:MULTISPECIES: SDR family oxidoreductase [Streptomyces]MCZ4097821.1 SDR family oxidoreductase [Streptomyces sp. H39-C1]QNA76770.1 SDR family oxidoreductase [Streptomyces sp. So13.3]